MGFADPGRLVQECWFKDADPGMQVQGCWSCDALASALTYHASSFCFCLFISSCFQVTHSLWLQLLFTNFPSTPQLHPPHLPFWVFLLNSPPLVPCYSTENYCSPQLPPAQFLWHLDLRSPTLYCSWVCFFSLVILQFPCFLQYLFYSACTLFPFSLFFGLNVCFFVVNVRICIYTLFSMPWLWPSVNLKLFNNPVWFLLGSKYIWNHWQDPHLTQSWPGTTCRCCIQGCCSSVTDDLTKQSDSSVASHRDPESVSVPLQWGRDEENSLLEKVAAKFTESVSWTVTEPLTSETAHGFLKSDSTRLNLLLFQEMTASLCPQMFLIHLCSCITMGCL